MVVPKEIKIGYRYRDETYQGLIGMLTYTTGKNKRNHHSGFDGYIDKSIPITECANEPLEGFYFNGVAGGEHCVSGRKKTLRVMDPRGFEFELGMEGINHVLTNATISPGKGIDGKFVYAWKGIEGLMILSVDSNEYKEHFGDEGKKEIPKKDLIIGNTYRNKSGKRFLYLGDVVKHDSWSEKKKLKEPNKYRMIIGGYPFLKVVSEFREITTKQSKKGTVYYFRVLENRKVFFDEGRVDKDIKQFFNQTNSTLLKEVPGNKTVSNIMYTVITTSNVQPKLIDSEDYTLKSETVHYHYSSKKSESEIIENLHKTKEYFLDSSICNILNKDYWSNSYFASIGDKYYKIHLTITPSSSEFGWTIKFNKPRVSYIEEVVFKDSSIDLITIKSKKIDEILNEGTKIKILGQFSYDLCVKEISEKEL